MKKLFVINILIIFILLTLGASRVYAGDIVLEINQDNREPAVITVTDNQNIKKVWVYQTNNDKKYSLIKVRNVENEKKVVVYIPVSRLSSDEDRNFKVVVEDEDGKYSSDVTVEKILPKEIVTPKPRVTTTPTPRITPTPVPTVKPTATPKTTSTATPKTTKKPTATPKTTTKTTSTPRPTLTPPPTPKPTTPKVTEESLRQKLVAVAKKEVGSKSGKKYLAFFGKPNAPNYWCSEFASWCGNQCGYYKAGIFPKFSYAKKGADWFKKKGRFKSRSYTPKPGDICFTGGSSPTHTAIVYKVNKDKKVFYTIDGGSNVKIHKRKLYGSNIYGFGVPDYKKLIK